MLASYFAVTSIHCDVAHFPPAHTPATRSAAASVPHFSVRRAMRKTARAMARRRVTRAVYHNACGDHRRACVLVAPHKRRTIARTAGPSTSPRGVRAWPEGGVRAPVGRGVSSVGVVGGARGGVGVLRDWARAPRDWANAPRGAVILPRGCAVVTREFGANSALCRVRSRAWIAVSAARTPFACECAVMCAGFVNRARPHADGTVIGRARSPLHLLTCSPLLFPDARCPMPLLEPP